MVRRWRERLTLLGRVYLLVAVLVALLALMAAGTLGFRQRADTTTEQVTDVVLPAQRSATELTSAYLSQARGARGFQLTGSEASREAYVTGRANAERLQSALSREMGHRPAVMSALADVRRAASEWHREVEEPGGGNDRSRDSPGNLRSETLVDQRHFAALRGELAVLQNRINLIAARETATADEARTAANWLTIGTVVVGLVTAAGTIVFLRKSLTLPLHTIVSEVDQVAEGNLESPVTPVGPPELSTVARAVETMRRRILDETSRITRIQQALARHEAAERKRAEQDYATVVAALDEGVMVIGSSGMIQSANPAAQRIFGVPESEIVGTTVASWPLFDESGVALRPQDLFAMSPHRTGDPEKSRVLRLDRPDGRGVWLSVGSRALNSRDPSSELVVVSFTDITESRATRQRLAYEATHDPLTGLANRILVLRHCAERSDEHPMALLYLDLDNFKRINDSLGHGTGDEVLRIIGERLVRATPADTLVGRLGGDEFVVLYAKEIEHNTLAKLAEDLIDALKHPIDVQGRRLHINGSIGISISPPGDTRTGQDLLRDADVAMYQAKTQSGRRYSFFDVELRERVQHHMVLEQDLRHAVEQDQLWVAYQPVVDVRSHQPVAVEGLLRWTHPVHGTISPNDFIPIAEESELINPIGEHMLDMATRQLAAERLRSQSDLQLNANLSPRQLEDPRLRSIVEQTLARSALPPGALCLEVTENTIMNDPVHSIRVLNELRALGVYLAIDDFGTGYSSLAQLRQLPLDTLKIDRSFVNDLGTSHDLEAIVGSIIGMAHAVGLKVVAEGVETGRQLDLLTGLDCDQVQGYYLGKPVPIDDLFTDRG